MTFNVGDLVRLKGWGAGDVRVVRAVSKDQLRLSSGRGLIITNWSYSYDPTHLTLEDCLVLKQRGIKLKSRNLTYAEYKRLYVELYKKPVPWDASFFQHINQKTASAFEPQLDKVGVKTSFAFSLPPFLFTIADNTIADNSSDGDCTYPPFESEEGEPENRVDQEYEKLQSEHESLLTKHKKLQEEYDQMADQFKKSMKVPSFLVNPGDVLIDKISNKKHIAIDNIDENGMIKIYADTWSHKGNVLTQDYRLAYACTLMCDKSSFISKICSFIAKTVIKLIAVGRTILTSTFGWLLLIFLMLIVMYVANFVGLIK